MTRRIPLVLGVCLFLLACRTAPIYEVEGRPLAVGFSASLARVGDAIEHAALALQWRTRRVKPGQILATKRRGPHAAHVVIQYDTSAVSIHLLRSIALSQANGRIHKTYNAWVHELEKRILFETGGVR